MRRLLLLLLALGLIAAACSSDSPGDATSNAAEADEPDTAVDDAEEGAASDAGTEAASEPAVDTAGEGDPADGESAAAPAADLAAETPTCSFEADLDVEQVDVIQLEDDPREGNPSALTNRLNLDFPEPLIDVDRILRGGPPPDGIPPIDSPVFQTAASVNWLQCDEPVLSLSIDGEARAYPIQIMTWHELVNDTFGAGTIPVTVSYCPLCNSALAYNRRVGDRIMSFGTSGSLFNSSLVMYDRQTESLWTHFNGSAVVGTLAGTELDLLPMQTTSWANFLQANPDGLVLTRDTGQVRRYGENPYVGYDNVNENPFLFDGEYDERLQAKQRVVSITRGGDSVAVVLDNLAEVGVVEAEVAGQALSVWHLPGTASALEANGVADGRDVGTSGVYVAVVDGQSLTFERDNAGAFVDVETGSTWNIGGLATDGSLAGTQLEAIEHLDTFWFAIAAFEPDTRIL